METKNMVSSILGMYNLNRCKYGAATIAAQILKKMNFDVDWDFAIDIFCDTDEYLNYKTESEYIEAVLVKYLEVINYYHVAPEAFEGFGEKSKSSFYYIVNEKEVHTLKKIWKKFITGLVDAYKVDNMEPVIEVLVKNVHSMYVGENEYKACEHFVKTVYNFFNYHSIDCKKMEFSKTEDNLFIIKFYV